MVLGLRTSEAEASAKLPAADVQVGAEVLAVDDPVALDGDPAITGEQEQGRGRSDLEPAFEVQELAVDFVHGEVHVPGLSHQGNDAEVDHRAGEGQGCRYQHVDLLADVAVEVAHVDVQVVDVDGDARRQLHRPEVDREGQGRLDV